MNYKPSLPIRLPLRALVLALAGLISCAFLSFNLLSCTTVAEDDTVTFKVQTAWLALDSFEVIWADPQGNAKAMLFAGPLQNEASLTNLPGQGYQGEAAVFTLRGFEGGVLVFEQKRVFDPKANPSLTVTTLLEPGTVTDPNPDTSKPDSIQIAIEPERLSLVVGETRSVQAKVTPLGTDPSATWVVVTPGIVELVVNAATSGQADIKALVPGETWVRVRSVADSNKFDSVNIEVFTLENAPPAITVFDPDTTLSIKDTVRFSAAFEARTGNLASWSLDFNGDGMVDKQENVTTKTHALNLAHAYADSGAFTAYLSVVDSAGRISRDSVKIGVRQDAPRVDAGRDTVIAVGKELAFAGKAEQDFGTFVEYRWDFTGDGVWDFKSPTTGTTTHTYAAEGNFEAVFEAEDDDGNISRDKRRVDIGNKAPVFSGTLPDTVITIKDTLEFIGWVSDADGTIAKLEWDFTGTGVFTHASMPGLARVDFAVERVFNAPNTIKVVARATDNGGKTWDDTVEVKVLLDAPIVDAGNDVTVIAGNAVTLVGSASDGKGDIVATEWKIGTGAFLSRGLGDTTFTAPTTPQEIWAYFRATDDDGNRVTDSVKIAVRASTNNLLQSLYVNSVNPAAPVSLLPASFNSGVFTYSGNVAHNISSVSITATPVDLNATLTVGVRNVASGTPITVTLDTGSNAIPIVVTAQDGSKETYTVTLTRAKDADNTLSALSAGTVGLTPTAFDPTHTTYAGSVASNVSAVSITATVASGTAKVTIKGQAATSGVALSVTLITGLNAIPIVVTAQNGAIRTYTLNITKAQNADNNLSALSAGTVGLSPTPFSSGTVAYAGTVASTVTSVSITATVASATSRVTINGQAATSGAPLSVNLPTASTAISIVVTAENGATKTYTVTITKAADTNNYLSALSAGTVALTPSTFDQATLAYAGSVASNVTSVSITATLASSTATMTINGAATNSNIARSVTLVGGPNPIPIVVTAQSGATRTYTITITRTLDANNNLSNLVPSAGTFTDAFSQSITTYDLVVPDATTSVRFTPTAAAPTTSTITVNGAAVNSGTQSAVINATAGTMTPVAIVVTAQSGATKTYTVRMHRGGWVQAGGLTGPSTEAPAALASHENTVYQLGQVTQTRVATMKRLTGSTWGPDPAFTGFSPLGTNDMVGDANNLFVVSAWTASAAMYRRNSGAWTGSSVGGPGIAIMAMGGGQAYYVYWDNTPASRTLHATRFTGTGWTELGNLPSGYNQVDLAASTTGTPWVAYSTSANTNLQVYRWSGSIWTTSSGGGTNATGGLAYGAAYLGIWNELPYVAFSDDANGGALTVTRASSGAVLGSRAFSPSGLILAGCKVDGSSGELIVVANMRNATSTTYSNYAWKWTGSAWAMLGTGPISTGSTSGFTFTMHQGLPWVGQVTAAGSQVFRYASTAPRP